MPVGAGVAGREVWNQELSALCTDDALSVRRVLCEVRVLAKAAAGEAAPAMIVPAHAVVLVRWRSPAG